MKSKSSSQTQNSTGRSLLRPVPGPSGCRSRHHSPARLSLFDGTTGTDDSLGRCFITRGVQACPPPELLYRLLDDALPADDEDAVVGHVERCQACQSVLQELTAASASVSRLIRDEKQDSDVPVELLNRIKQAGCPAVRGGRSAESLVFPDASDDGASLGRLGRYRICEEVGRGACGYLFRAFDPLLNRTVAVKILRSELAVLTSACRRFEREGRAVAQLDHEQIVRVHEVGSPADFLPYLVMEFISGESLSAMLRRRGAIDSREAANILSAVLSGLQHAHENGVIHRDIKPANILIDTSGRIRLVDFGLARLDDHPVGQTTQRSIAGTPAYMSAEQVLNPAESDARSDVYSAGIVLFELLTGEVPFRGVTRMVLHQVVHEDAKSPRKLNDAVPKDLETICLKAIAREPARRYQSAREFMEDLDRWRRDEPIRARRVTIPERIWRTARRNPMVFALCASVLVLLCGLAAVWADLTLSLTQTNEQLALRNRALLLSADQTATGERAARSNARLAARQANLAFDLINQLVFDVQDELSGQHAPAALRESLLTRAVSGLDELAATIRHAKEPHVSLVVALNRLGDAYQELSQPQAAAESYHRALQICEQLLTKTRSEPNVLQCKMWTHFNLGRVRFPDDAVTAASCFRTAADIGTDLSRMSAASSAIRKDAAVTAAHALRMLATHEFGRKNPEAAEQCLRKAVSQLQIALSEGETAPETERQLAAGLCELAELNLDSNRVEARKLLSRAAGLLQTLIETDSDSSGTADFVMVSLNLAELELRENNLSEVERHLAHAAATRSHLAERGAPHDNASVSSMSECIAGRLAAARGRLTAAKEHFTRAVSILDAAGDDVSANLSCVRVRLTCLLNLALTEEAVGNRQVCLQHLLVLQTHLDRLLRPGHTGNPRWLEVLRTKVDEVCRELDAVSVIRLTARETNTC